MILTGLHLLLSYQCNYECDHCFVWGSPFNEGTMTLAFIRRVLKDAQDLRTIKNIYFEGGEPFLYYPIMVQGIREAVEAGFEVGIVTNAYWATSIEDAEVWLRPIAEIGISDLSLSSDLYHGDRMETSEAMRGRETATKLGIPVDLLQTCGPVLEMNNVTASEISNENYGRVMFKGRAAEKLAHLAKQHKWTEFTECDSEELEDPGRVHIDPFGFIHVCQGISIGNLLKESLSQIVDSYKPNEHPIIGPLIEEGPVALVKKYHVPHESTYADACHLCYQTRKLLRSQFPNTLTPNQMYNATPDSTKAP